MSEQEEQDKKEHEKSFSFEGQTPDEEMLAVREKSCPVCGTRTLCDCVGFMNGAAQSLDIFLGRKWREEGASISLPIEQVQLFMARLNYIARIEREKNERYAKYFKANNRDISAGTASAMAQGRKSGIETAVGSLYILMQKSGMVGVPVSAPEPGELEPYDSVVGSGEELKPAPLICAGCDEVIPQGHTTLYLHDVFWHPACGEKLRAGLRESVAEKETSDNPATIKAMIHDVLYSPEFLHKAITEIALKNLGLTTSGVYSPEDALAVQIEESRLHTTMRETGPQSAGVAPDSAPRAEGH